MARPVILLIALVAPLLLAAPRPRTPDRDVPAGKWRVEFANGVVETCEIGPAGRASVVEPLRASPGKWSVKDGAVLIHSDDDRLERWRRVDGQWVVEHWCPVAAYPAGPSVPGV